MRTTTLSLAEARRLAIVSQAFGTRPAKPSIAHLRQLIGQLHAFQIDSVNVLTRAHYVPAFARLGPYSVDLLDSLAYKRRELFEFWGHAACLLPNALYPLVRYRMEWHVEHTRKYMKSRRGGYMTRVLAEVAEKGALGAGDLSNPGTRSGSWWGWGTGKAALEHLFDAGLLSIAGRRGFERLYDLTERVIPKPVLDAPAPPREQAMKELICLAASACGVGTIVDVLGYFYVDAWHDRLPPGPYWERPAGDAGGRRRPIAKRLVAELVEEKRLIPVQVEGWTEPAYLSPGARIPKHVDARALVTPFDSLVWERDRIERLFGMRYRIELYTPAARRQYGYYVCPFLLGDTLVARCDLKADRSQGILRLQSAFLEPKQKAGAIAPALMEELDLMRQWLGLEHVQVADRGDLAPALRRHRRSSRRADRQDLGD
jgi:hypothetical protein